MNVQKFMDKLLDWQIKMLGKFGYSKTASGINKWRLNKK